MEEFVIIEIILRDNLSLCEILQCMYLVIQCFRLGVLGVERIYG